VKPKPLVVVEGPAAVFAGAVADVRSAGRRTVAGWTVAGDDAVCVGSVADAEDAAAALLAAVGGAGIVVHAVAPREIVDRLCEDLRRLGRLEHVVGAEPRPRLTREEAALLDLLLDGLTLGEAAERLGLARRTADRRLAAARAKLGVATTAEALVARRGR
jgi:DNA-binding NarL/FixJ family response regulator